MPSHPASPDISLPALKIHNLPTPSILIDLDALERNISRMQGHCDAGGVRLWPHVKSHKCQEVLRRQIAAGASGITCAKLGEAEAMIPSGIRRIFLAHSLATRETVRRARLLSEQVEQFLIAVTSPAHARHLAAIAQMEDARFPVFAALDTGLGREGARSAGEFAEIVRLLERSRHLELRGVYTHEGHLYRGNDTDQLTAKISEVHHRLREAARVLPADAEIAPGCSVSAAKFAEMSGITMVRPGAYALGDLHLSRRLGLMEWDDCALTILATIVDRPEPELALIDAGSKTFSGDKLANGESGRGWKHPDLAVTGVNEEHGYIRGLEVRRLRIGDQVRFVPAHVCPVMNLTDSVQAVRGDDVIETWQVEGRGRVQ